MPREPDGGHPVSDRQPDSADEQRPATGADEATTPPWSTEPVRRTDGQRWEASVGSWSATPARPAEDEQRPSWEVPQEPAEAGATNGAPAPSWQQPSWAAAAQQPWAQPAPAQTAQPQPASAKPAPAQPAPSQSAPSQSASPSWQPAGPQTWAAPQGAQPTAYGAGPQDGRPSAPVSLTSQTLLRQHDDVPRTGWRGFVHKATGGAYNPGLSQAEIEHRQLVARVTTPVRGSNRIAVVSLKGGIGKTTTTSCLGLTLAHHRGDRVVAVDANPDAGTLAERLTNVTDVTVRDLLANVGSIRSFTDVSSYTSLAGRLQVLASDQDPALSEAFSEDEYTTVADILARYFNIILTDSGTGLLHSAMSGTLSIADSLVVVGAPSVDGASRASKTLDWLIAHGHEELVARSVAVISSVRPNTGDV